MKGAICTILLFLAVVKSDTCISMVPSLSKTSNCLGGVSCQYGLYCDVQAKCSDQIAIGGACDSTVSAMCVYGSACKGPKGNQICVQYANPGSACNQTVDSLVPYCGSGLSCSFLTNMCTGGQLGDYCFNKTDCSVHNCTASICAATPNGGTCFGSGQSTCSPQSYCNSNQICTPKITVGGICSGILPCADGMYCIGLTNTDQTICVQNQTRMPGEYCGGFDEMCKDSRKCKQANDGSSYCARSSPDDCTSDSSCSPAQVCTCNGITNAAGYAKCVNNPCDQKKNDLITCLWTKCGISTPSSSQGTYPGSCYNTNCKDLATAYKTCSSGFKAVPSVLFVTLLALFISKMF